MSPRSAHYQARKQQNSRHFQEDRKMALQIPTRFDAAMDTARDRRLTFHQKVVESLEKRREGPAASPRNLNRYFPFVFLAEITIVWYYGTCQAIPFLYADFGHVTVTVLQWLACFMALEIVLNWWCVYNVNSNYDPDRHGTRYDPHVTQQQSGSQNTMATTVDMQAMQQEVRASGPVISPDNTGPRDTAPARIPYWSWRYCSICDKPRPPRCHHCSLCNRCSLKRDHHCYFSRNCVGYRNLRHYTVMVFWSCVSSIFAFVHALPFVMLEVLPNAGYVDIVPFVAFIRWCFGYAHFRVGIVILATWMLSLFIMFTTFMLSDVCKCIVQGKTSFEIDNKITIRDSRSLGRKLRAVFGDFWLFNFLLPMHWRFHPEEDPVHWPTISQ